MASSSFGNYFRITTWGESHGKAIGVVVDGCPAGLPLCEADIQHFLDRRKPGQTKYATPRKEDDAVEILSGVFEGRTTGTPISLIVPNTSQKSHDYSEIANYYRPGHADYTYDEKYGFRDYRGGGRSSGRETIGRVAAGAIASKILSQLGIQLMAYTASIGPISIDPGTLANITRPDISASPTCMPDPKASLKAEAYLEECMSHKDSVGGSIECVITGCPAGIGDPVFLKLDALFASALMSIGSVKAIEIGSGSDASKALGSAHNDVFRYVEGQLTKDTNHAGGILGGISDGSDILLRAHLKPTPSIFAEQETINDSGENIQIKIKGRHDPVIVPRAVVVVESMAAITLLDAMFSNMHAKLDSLTSFYGKAKS